jgi:signal transduction histidine kinase
LATSAWPAWLWSTDSSRLLWANAVGAAIFSTRHTADIGQRRFNAGDPSAAQIARLAATLPPGGQERLERLRGFGASFGRALTCVCARLTMPDSVPAVIIAATEPAGPSLDLAERIRRLLPDGPEALAAFAPDGTLLFANSAASAQLGRATTLSALGLKEPAATALVDGQANGVLHLSQKTIEATLTRLGKNETRVLVLALRQPQPSTESTIVGAATDTQTPSADESLIATNATAAAAEAPPARTSIPQGRESAEERRHPLRFVWQMDAEGRFVVGSDEFIELVGPRSFTACGRLWSEISAELKLDPDNQIARAVATHETWSSIPISWPVDETDERLPVELSALPVFDRDRVFRGYRGFGVCRDVERLNQLVRARRVRPIGFTPAPAPSAVSAPDRSDAGAAVQNAAETPTPDTTTDQPAKASKQAEPAAEPAPPARPAAAELLAAGNVVPFRSGAAPDTKAPSLNPVERSAFRELAQELTARLRAAHEDPSVLSGEPYAAGELSAPTAMATAITQVVADIPPIAPVVAAEVPSPTPSQQPAITDHPLLDRVPVGILIYRGEALLYANRRFLELSGYDDIEALSTAGGLNTLFTAPQADALTDAAAAAKLMIATHRGDKLPVEGRLFSAPWNGTSALMLILTDARAEERQRTTQAALDAAQNEVRDIQSNLDRVAWRETQKAAAAKADFLAKVNREIRTPLNSMIGFAEVIMAERFGSIGNERYREYLRDMHAAGTHIVSMLNDLLDLSKIETGQLDLTFADVDLNNLTQQCVGIMQPQANRARIIIRTALTPGLLQVMADTRSLRQIVINLLTNAIKFTGPGGQVIVSTAVGDAGEAVLRVRDTGVGMREADLEAVLNPFQQTASSTGWGPGEIGLGLPLTKALAEANRAIFSIKSAPNSGTLIEVAFPRGRLAVH